MLETAGGDGGVYRSSHPWVIAGELFQRAAAAGDMAALLLFDLDNARFSRWGVIRDIDVVEFHRGGWETQVQFARLRDIPLIWAELDSIQLQPSAEQLRRERVEPIGISRTPCTRHALATYAICEPPAFTIVAGS